MASLLIPLLCALLYPLGTLLVKRAMDQGADMRGALLINFWMMALVFLAAVPLESRAVPWPLWWQPFLVGVTAFAGQGFAYKAIASGDLTIATPAMGSKVLLVALLTETLLGQTVPLAWWVAAVLSFAAVLLLQSGIPASRRNIRLTLAYSVLAAAGFALGDVLIQRWAPAWGPFHFVAAFATVSAFLSLGLLPSIRKPRLRFGRPAWSWLLPGAAVLSLQSLGLTGVIGYYGQATLVNIVFSSRGLWNFLLVWYLGHWFANREREAGGRVMAGRLLGAALMFAAIVIASLS